MFFVCSYAQKLPYTVIIVNEKHVILKELSGQADSLRFQKLIKTEYFKLLKKGYILADVIQTKNDTLFHSKIATGQVYRWGNFNINQIPDALLSKSGYIKNQFDNKQINVDKLGKLLAKLIKESDYTGYPFATVKLDSVFLLKEKISATVLYSPGPQIKYAQLTILNNEFVKNSYLESYLEIKKDELFNSKDVESISKKIKNLSFCKLDSLPKIRFENKTCKLTLHISPVKANKVDAMIGLAPNQLDNNKMLATGYINLDLHNLFRSGKRLSFIWRQFGVQSQTLKTMYNHTNLFKSVINIRGKFNLFKQDTAFINRNIQIAIGYDNANYSVNLTSSFIDSRLLSTIDSTSLEDLELIDFNAQYYGIEFTKNEFDYVINPTRGWSIKSSINLGAKNILNTTFVSVELYDSLKRQSLQGNFSITSDVAIPISRLFVAYSKIELATISSNGKLFKNDLYRLGGVNLLRGFNELEIYSSSYVMVQLEARLLLNEKSRLFGFIDWAFSENQVLNYNDTFLGLGAGMIVDTPSGVVQLVYAVGKSSKQSLSLAESKIHFGYVARF